MQEAMRRENMMLLIVPYGIETRDGIPGAGSGSSFNRTLWN